MYGHWVLWWRRWPPLATTTGPRPWPVRSPYRWCRHGLSPPRWRRSEALARTITDAYYEANAFTTLVEAVGAAGDQARAITLAGHVEALGRGIAAAGDQGRALAAVVEAVAAVGDVARAEALGRVITDPGDQARALAG